MTISVSKRPRVMSGMRPTGPLHLGHLVGVLTQWATFCETADAFFEIADLYALLSMITPVSWLERVPTYKGQIEALGQKIATYGFLGYPLLQLCDIAIFRGEYVPVGRDQVAHLEFGREVVRRFNYVYGEGREVLVEPQPTLTA